MIRADDIVLGARLEGCDGISADRLAARNAGACRGRWTLVSQHVTQGGRLFPNAGNPYLVHPARCRFVVDGRLREVGQACDARLRWRSRRRRCAGAASDDLRQQRSVRRETGVDSLCIDVRQVALPSGFARAVTPVKVYRGRRRG
jgi:hypothetical protein